jgi:hypothetical protein
MHLKSGRMKLNMGYMKELLGRRLHAFPIERAPMF